jgi:hypothetical protein
LLWFLSFPEFLLFVNDAHSFCDMAQVLLYSIIG